MPFKICIYAVHLCSFFNLRLSYIQHRAEFYFMSQPENPFLLISAYIYIIFKCIHMLKSLIYLHIYICMYINNIYKHTTSIFDFSYIIFIYTKQCMSSSKLYVQFLLLFVVWVSVCIFLLIFKEIYVFVLAISLYTNTHIIIWSFSSHIDY